MKIHKAIVSFLAGILIGGAVADLEFVFSLFHGLLLKRGDIPLFANRREPTVN